MTNKHLAGQFELLCQVGNGGIYVILEKAHRACAGCHSTDKKLRLCSRCMCLDICGDECMKSVCNMHEVECMLCQQVIEAPKAATQKDDAKDLSRKQVV